MRSSEVVTGMVATWRVAFLAVGPDGGPTAEAILELDQGDYHAEVETSAATSLRAARFRVRIAGLSDRDFQTIAKSDNEVRFLRIELGWQEADEPHEVLTGRIREVRRRRGEGLYVTEFAGIDWQYHHLASVAAPAIDIDRPATTNEIASQLLADTPIALEMQPPGSDGPELGDGWTPSEEDNVLRALGRLSRAAGGGKQRRLPMFLRADGLYVGHWRAPVADRGEHPLSLDTGLVEATPVLDLGPERLDEDPFSAADASAIPYDLTCLGRPDIRPGDQVLLAVDDWTGIGAGISAGVAAIAGSEAPTTPFRVVSVSHRFGSRHGFTTSLRVEPEPEDDEADADADADRRAEQQQGDRTAAAIDGAIQQAIHRHRPLAAGDLIGAHGDGDAVDQRSDLAVGLDPGVTPPDRYARAPIAPEEEDRHRLPRKPALTPFAFGRTGLVVPRYPHTRVLVHQPEGDQADAVIGGQLWREGQEPESQPGDWWLSLPVDLAEPRRDDDVTADPAEVEKTVGDLTDAAGRRSIHLRALRIVVGEDGLLDVGTRPDPGSDNIVEITHAEGSASITMDAEGTITINAAKNIDLAAGENITMSAKKVEVTVDTTMEVN